MKTGVELIAEERQRQIEVEGWTPEHDDSHDAGELAKAAMVYCHDYPSKKFVRKHWPFKMKWYKPNPVIGAADDRIRELSKAGALIAAEIDRLNRL